MSTLAAKSWLHLTTCMIDSLEQTFGLEHCHNACDYWHNCCPTGFNDIKDLHSRESQCRRQKAKLNILITSSIWNLEYHQIFIHIMQQRFSVHKFDPFRTILNSCISCFDIFFLKTFTTSFYLLDAKSKYELAYRSDGLASVNNVQIFFYIYLIYSSYISLKETCI